MANSDDCDPGFVGERFRHHGFSFAECHREHPGDWPALEGHDLLVLLGSEWSVYWPHVADHVGAEVALVQQAVRRGVPVFGVCFGTQVLAHALGGSVRRADTAEIGWMHVESDVPDVVASGPWMEWHYDVVTLPGGATELARTAVGPQAWLLGRTFSTQFHPEVHEGIIRRWASGHGADELHRIGSSPDQLLDTTRRSCAASREHNDRMIDWFVDTVATTPFVDVLPTA